MRARRILVALSSLAVVAAGLALTPSASADSVQYQSYGRASQTEACAAQVGETPWQASWGTDSSWKPSWEQWANAGKGGWTCTRGITWARDSVARTYALGDIGPGGGLVFLISGGLTYEMAPNTWSGAGTPDAGGKWCVVYTDVLGAAAVAVGRGAANTAAMAASSDCSSDAAAAVLAYAPAGTSAGQWFLPSKDELNAMCNYSRNLSAPAAPSESCHGSAGSTQDRTFANGAFGFFSTFYWSSSQYPAWAAWDQDFEDGGHAFDLVTYPLGVRPVRAF